MNDLTGKIAFITGASKGIGASIASHFAIAGAEVIVNYSSSKEAAEQVVSSIKDAGGKASVLQGDLSKPQEVYRSFAAIAQSHGKLDILVNNAGVFKFNALDALTPEEFYRHFDLNVLGLLLACREMVKLVGAEGGSILNISSVVASMAPARSTVYAATKGAMESITTALSKELGPRQIRVNSLAPGGILTEGTALSAQTSIFREMKERTPLGRLGMPEDIARIAVLLASSDAYWINGQHIIAAGGMTM